MFYEGGNEGISAVAHARRALWLLDEVRWVLRLKQHSLCTEQAYVRWIRRFVLADGKRHPR